MLPYDLCPENYSPYDPDVIMRPGPQPHNQIAPTAKEQLARVFKPRPLRPVSGWLAERLAVTMSVYPDVFEPVLAKLLGPRIKRYHRAWVEQFCRLAKTDQERSICDVLKKAV